MDKRKILIQLDTDPHPSSFDAVVAVDSGADVLLSHGSVSPDAVEGLVHGAMFTRKPSELARTAIFVGGRNVSRAEELMAAVTRAFFGPFRVSVMLDASGANTTAAAAVLSAAKEVPLAGARALVLGGTGPVGQRVALLLAREGARVWVGSRTLDRARDVCESIKGRHVDAVVAGLATGEADSIAKHPEHFQIIVAAGAAGARLLRVDQLAAHSKLRVVVDLNAVPPSGIEGVEPTDAGREANGVKHYGALGVGGLKMKIHRAALARLFEANDHVLDAEEIYAIGKAIS